MMNKHRILCRANRLEGGEVHALLVLRNLNERSTEGKVKQTTLVEQEPQDRAPVIPTGAGGHSSPSQRRCCLKANQAAASASLGEPGLPWTTADTRIQNIPLLQMKIVLLPLKKSSICKLHHGERHSFLAPLWGGLIFEGISST